MVSLPQDYRQFEDMQSMVDVPSGNLKEKLNLNSSSYDLAFSLPSTLSLGLDFVS